MRTQIGIVGAGPAGLLLSHLLALRGIDTIVVESRSRAYCEARQRAGVLEDGTVRLLRETGVGHRLDQQGLEHGGIYLQFAGERHHLDFRALTGGRTVTVYAQTEVVKDLIEERLARGLQLEFEVTDTQVDHLDSDQPVLRYTDSGGTRREVVCDAIAGCDGFHGITRQQFPPGLLTISERDYPYAWLGILADVPPSTDELIYAHHPNGFALHSLRSCKVSRLYLQVDPDESIGNWSDSRIWDELHRRFELPGWFCKRARCSTRASLPCAASSRPRCATAACSWPATPPISCPPTGAKGLNLAMADVTVLAPALDGLLRGRPALADAYSATCLNRVWRSTHFSWWMTTMLHRTPGADAMEAELQLSQLRYVVSSEAAATSLAENYTGYPQLRLIHDED